MGAISTSHPRCFMHVPKCGGTSVHGALERALPAGSLSPRQRDTSEFRPGFDDLNGLDNAIRALIAADDDEISAMRESPVVSGHFSLGSLMQVAPPSSISTLLREPRARLLSLYAFWRLHTPEQRRPWPFSAFEAADRSLDDFLEEPSSVPAVDNAVCRMLLYDLGLIAPNEFIPRDASAEIARAALERLQTLGLVAVLELPQRMWTELSRFFGVHLEPRHAHATGVVVSLRGPPAAIDITPKTLELLELRTAADAVLYEDALMRRGISQQDIRRLAEAAFAQQLVKLGDVLGTRAARVGDLEAERAGVPIQTIAAVVPEDEPLIVVDDQQWGLQSSVDGRRVIPFLERNGEYWGLPPDSATAIRELERLRRSGVRFIAIGRPSFWWLDHYVAFRQRLETTADCRARSEDIVIFDIGDHR